MKGLDDDGHTQRVKRFLKALRDLMRESFLHLETPGKNIHDPRDLAQAYDLALGDVGDMAFAVKRQKMMLAKAVNIQVFHHDHFVVFFIEHG